MLDIEDRLDVSARASRRDVASCGLEADRSGPKATVPADNAVNTGSLPEGSCMRADVFKESVGVDTVVEGKKDTDVGRFDVIVRPRIEIPLELSYGPSVRPAAECEIVGPMVGVLSGGPQLVASRPPLLSSLDGLVEAHALGESDTPLLLAQLCRLSSSCRRLRLRLPPRVPSNGRDLLARHTLPLLFPPHRICHTSPLLLLPPQTHHSLPLPLLSP